MIKTSMIYGNGSNKCSSGKNNCMVLVEWKQQASNKLATRKDYRIRFKAMEIVIYKE